MGVMIRDLAIALLSAAGLGVTGLVTWIITCLIRVGPEFPPPGPVQRDP